MISSALTSCASFQIPNEEICVEFPSGKAYCKHTLTEDERFIEKSDWEELRVGRLSMTSDAWGNYMKLLKKVCTYTDRCSEEEKKEIYQEYRRMKAWSKPLYILP